MTPLLDQLRAGGVSLLEHELPSLDEMRAVVGGLVKFMDSKLADDDVANVGPDLIAAAAAPTNDGPANVGDANGGQPGQLVTAMPSADDIAAALIRAGAIPGLTVPHTPTESVAAPAAPPVVAADVPPAAPAPQPAGAHTADPDAFTPSPLPEPKRAPVIETSDAPVPPLNGEDAIRAALTARGASPEAIAAALGEDVPEAPAEAPADPPPIPGAAIAGVPPETPGVAGLFGAPPATEPVPAPTAPAPGDVPPPAPEQGA